MDIHKHLFAEKIEKSLPQIAFQGGYISLDR